VAMENELSRLAGRKVDLRTPGDLGRHFREGVIREAEVRYAKS
jgi:predicted nucleotidyltransferase